MKNIFIYIIAVFITFSLTSCFTQMMTRSPQEVKMMTTKQFETNKDLVFKSTMSLLQSESYLIEDANDRTGLIRAYKRLQNENADLERILLGSSEDASTSKVSIYIEEFNPNLTEVKITLYEGEQSTTETPNGVRNKDIKEGMVYDPEIYNQWFNNLRAEIERRKALTQ